MAEDLVTEIKNTAEFKLLFNHLIPLRRYMALSFLQAGDGLSKYIPETDKILAETKTSIVGTIKTLFNSEEYTYRPRGSIQKLTAHQAHMGRTDTQGKYADTSLKALMIILKTPLLILKGYVETTDPAVIIAKRIIDVANMAAMAIIAGVEQGLQAGRQVAQMAVNEAQGAAAEMESLAAAPAASASPAWEMMPQEARETYYDGVLDVSGRVANWTIPTHNGTMITDAHFEFEDTIFEFSNVATELNTAVTAYLDAVGEVEKAQEALDLVDEQMQETIKQIKETTATIMNSPFMLLGLWSALLPSQFPLLGGLIPFPFPGGPPSTIPGMIYLLLMFLDAFEWAMEEEINELNEDECEDQL